MEYGLCKIHGLFHFSFGCSWILYGLLHVLHYWAGEMAVMFNDQQTSVLYEFVDQI